MLQLKPNILNTIYVISNMHLNYNFDICPSLFSKSLSLERVRVWVSKKKKGKDEINM
jgi:hypothetical protein